MNRIDNFAFTIMHELGHIKLHLEKDRGHNFIDVDPCIKIEDKREIQANEYATQALWNGYSPSEIFPEIENPYAAEKILRAIAQKCNMNVGIVTGQYHHFCQERNIVKNSYAICRDLIAKIG
jgi:HTH-type transcriptional regulator/antitoxin HigA